MVASYWTVPPQVLPVDIGVAPVFWVRNVPALFTVVAVNALVCILTVPPAVVLNVVTDNAPSAVSVPPVLLKVRVLYVPAGTY